MRRAGAAMVAFLLTGCGTSSGPVLCGPCPGPGYVGSGIPDHVRHGVVRVCVGDEPCTTTRVRGDLRPGMQQFVQLRSTGFGWDHYDGTRITVDVRSRGRHWTGAGTLDYRAGGGDSPCSCDSLVGDVAFERVNPPGSPR